MPAIAAAPGLQRRRRTAVTSASRQLAFHPPRSRHHADQPSVEARPRCSRLPAWDKSAQHMDTNLSGAVTWCTEGSSPSATCLAGTPASTNMMPKEKAMTPTKTANNASKLRMPQRSIKSSRKESTAVMRTPAAAPKAVRDKINSPKLPMQPKLCSHVSVPRSQTMSNVRSIDCLDASAASCNSWRHAIPWAEPNPGCFCPHTCPERYCSLGQQRDCDGAADDLLDVASNDGHLNHEPHQEPGHNWVLISVRQK